MANDLVIGIGAEYLGKPAFDKAQKSVTGLDKTVNALTKRFLGLFAAQKLAAYGKASIIAFQADTNAAKQLTATLNNLGLAFEDDRAKRLVANLEAQYHVADDQLRPALSSLLKVTGSLAKSQSLLETALNMSAASGQDLQSSTQDLAQAYVGNLKGLKKYNLGLTNAELATKSFTEIQALLNKNLQGQAAIKAADPLVALGLAADNAKEIIGKGLVEALNDAVGAGTGINDITANIESLARGISNVIQLLGKVTGFFSYGARGLIQSGKDTLNFFGLGDKNNPLQMPKGSYTKGGGKAIDIAAAARKKAEDEAIKRNKELLALAQKQARAAADAAKAKKEQAILEKAQQLFNMDLIENVAALQGKVTKDEELRLKTQQALLLGNAEAAGQLAMNLLKSQEEAMKARMIDDPFGGWTSSALAALSAIQAMIAALNALGVKSPVSYMPTISTAAGTLYTSSTGLSSNDLNAGTFSQYYQGLSGGLYGSTPVYSPTVNVTVQGSVTTESDLVNSITQGIYNKQAAGTPITYNTVM